MSHFEGLRYAEISERLGIPVGTVKSRMAEAVRRLRETLSGDEGDA
jgi:RNA polymerase sigma-70 factor (ECF subfamily)